MTPEMVIYIAARCFAAALGARNSGEMADSTVSHFAKKYSGCVLDDAMLREVFDYVEELCQK